MIKTIVVDDEWYNLKEICELIESTGFMTVAKKYQNPIQALEEAEDICPQVAFIDIEMPEMDGLTLAEKLLESDSSIRVAFITAWNQYAVQAFDLNALDYIMKPIRIERFHRMAEKIRNEIGLKVSLKSKVLKIKCFDQLETSIGGVLVKWERTKAEELFAFLLMKQGCFIHKDTIIENLWTEYDPVKALSILQTSVCKIRNVFSQIKDNVTLEYSGSRYCLKILNAECDYIKVELALSGYKVNNKATYVAVYKACELFGKGFLTQQGYLWSIEKDEELRKRLVMILKEIILQQSVRANDREASRALKLLVQLVPYDEDANYQLLELLKRMGNHNVLLSHFKWLNRVLKEEYGILPSKRIQKLIHEKQVNKYEK